MASLTTATLDANDEVCGPVYVPAGQAASWLIRGTSGTITYNPEVSLNGTNYEPCLAPDMSAAQTFIADASGQFIGPGHFRMRASGVSGGSGSVDILLEIAINGRVAG